MKQLLTITFTLLFFHAGSNNPETKPNIEFILINDMYRTDVGIMEAKYETPNNNRLTKNGDELFNELLGR